MQITTMALNDNLWYLGAQFMASIQARDDASAQRQLGKLLQLIDVETQGRFSTFKLRTLQILTNANRAAFSAGASTDQLAEHSASIIERFDQSISKQQLIKYAHEAVKKTVGLVPGGETYKDSLVQEAISFIRDHFAEAVTRDQVAARLDCSPAHFSRMFSKSTGYSFKDFILQCRLEKAKELLKNSHMNVSEIADQVGYRDPFQFSRIFRKRVGVSPSQYRDSRIGNPSRTS